VQKRHILAALKIIRVNCPDVANIHACDESRLIFGNRDQIDLKLDGKVWRFTFSHGWGDCDSGCINHHYFCFSYRPDTQEATKTGEQRQVLEDCYSEDETYQRNEPEEAMKFFERYTF
jgi:hypothetical protein